MNFFFKNIESLFINYVFVFGKFGSWVLGGLLFFWQMPHFQAIAWKNQEDYERGGYKMLVNTNRDVCKSLFYVKESLTKLKKQLQQVAGVAFRYSVPLLFVGPLSYMAGMTSEWYGFVIQNFDFKMS